MTRTRTNWKIRDHALTIGERTLIMGVLNVTPDSFSDGGKYLDPDAAVQRALDLEAQGADILDIGAESTKPGSERINAGEELRRLVPVLKKLKGQLGIPISVDTYKAEVAEKALEHGASVINDVSALTWEPDIVKAAVKYDAGLILNHMRGTPQTWAKLGPMKDVMGSILAELEAAVHRAVRGGVARERIVIDPGIGFGKRGDQNSEILARLGELQRLLLPVLAAVSRKSFLSQDDPKALEYATAAAITTAILNGAAIVRVHDVAAMKPVVQTTDAIIAATPEKEEKPKPHVKPRLDAEIQAEKRARPVRPPTPPPATPPAPVIVPPPPPPPVAPRRPFEPRVAPPHQEDRPERRPFQRRDDDRKPPSRDRAAFKPRDDKGGDRPERRPFQRRDDDRKPPSRDRAGFKPRDEKGGDRAERRPFQRRDDDRRPPSRDRAGFKPRDEKGGDVPERRPYQRRDDDRRPPSRDRAAFKPRDDKGGDRPERRPFQRSGPPDRDRKPYQREGSSEERSDRRPPSGRPPGGRPPAGRPSGPRNTGRGDRPGGDRPPRQGGGKPFGPKRSGGGPPSKRSGGPPRGGPRKRT